MDERLLAWGRAVKQRRRSKLPVLWLFTDAARLPDPLPAIAALPRGRCGVVFRHDGAPERIRLAEKIARLCRERRLALVVAGDPRLAAGIGAGLHLRRGRVGRIRTSGLITSSAHDISEIRRAARAGAKIVFLSPVFATLSHPAMPALGPVRCVNIMRQFNGLEVYCLGGITGQNIGGLGQFGTGAGAITALIP